jgi:tripartite-type tricarboxylate transporter receptor subunit TctC
MTGFAGAAGAQGYPAKPIRFVITYPTGGGSDFTVRPIAQKLSERWGQPVVVESRPGGSAMIGTDFVARSAPDGYTLLLSASSEVSMNVVLFKKMPYDPVRDLQPVTLVGTTPPVLLAHPSLPVKSMKELIALARAKPGQLNYASPGPGTTGHLAGELFKRMVGVEYTIIPFKGGGPAALAMLSGETQFTFATALSVQGHIKSGKLRALAVTTAKRSVSFPELPTVAEAGVPGFDAITWHGVVVPARTPQPVIARLNREFNKLLQTPDMRERLLTLGSEVIGGEPKQLTEYMRVEVPRWAKVIKESGAKPE